MIDIKKHLIFTEEIYSFKMPNFDFWKKEVTEIIKVENNKVHQHSTDIENESNIKARRTAWDTHHRYQSMWNLSQEFIKIIKAFVAKENFDAPNIKVNNLWINWYDKNQMAIPHLHNCHLSLVFFIDVEKTNTSFFIHKEYKNFFLIKKNESSTFNNKIVDIKVKDGTCIMFDGGLQHSTTPNFSDQLRITLAVNFEVVYPIKKEKYEIT